MMVAKNCVCRVQVVFRMLEADVAGGYCHPNRDLSPLHPIVIVMFRGVVHGTSYDNLE